MTRKMKRWTPRERYRLVRLLKRHSLKDAAVKLGRSYQSVASQANLMWPSDKLITRRRWSAADVQFVLDEYGPRSNHEIAKALGRTVKSIHALANRLGLKKLPQRLVEMGRENVNVRWARYAGPLPTPYNRKRA